MGKAAVATASTMGGDITLEEGATTAKTRTWAAAAVGPVALKLLGMVIRMTPMIPVTKTTVTPTDSARGGVRLRARNPGSTSVPAKVANNNEVYCAQYDITHFATT